MFEFLGSTAFRVLVALLALTLGFRSAIFLPDSWEGGRQPGETLDGYWRFATSEACYRDTPVVQFDGTNAIMYRYAKRTLLHSGTQFSFSNGRAVLNQPADQNNPSLQIYFEDLGSKLNAFRIVDDGISYTKEEYAAHTKQTSEIYDMIKCSDYAFMSRLKLIANSPMEDSSVSQQYAP